MRAPKGGMGTVLTKEYAPSILNRYASAREGRPPTANLGAKSPPPQIEHEGSRLYCSALTHSKRSPIGAPVTDERRLQLVEEPLQLTLLAPGFTMHACGITLRPACCH